MRTADELRAMLDALPRPVAITGYMQILAIDPMTGKARKGEEGRWVTSGNPEEALFMLRYMLEGEQT